MHVIVSVYAYAYYVAVKCRAVTSGKFNAHEARLGKSLAGG